MHIKVLGCHGADQLIQRTSGSLHYECCGFLIDGVVLLDAGTVGSKLTLAEQRNIRFVLLSHLHFDHIKSLPTLVDNLAQAFDEPITVMGTEPVLQGLKDHVFNGKVYPNFFEMPNGSRPILRGAVLQPEKWTTVGELEIMSIPVNHTVPTVGFIVKDSSAALLYSSDTYETERIWAEAGTIPNLKAVFIESSFPDELSAMARHAKHLTPALLAQEWAKLRNSEVHVYAYHLKPPFHDDIARQLKALKEPHVNVLEEGQELTL